MVKILYLCYALLVSLALLPVRAVAADSDAIKPGIADQDSFGDAGRCLTGQEGDPREALRRQGIDLSVSLTQFNQEMVSGDGKHGWEYGGKLIGKHTLSLGPAAGAAGQERGLAVA
jgi:hypothetical protein